MTASHMRTNFALGPSTPTLWRLTRAPSSNNDKVSARRSACAIPTFAHSFARRLRCSVLISSITRRAGWLVSASSTAAFARSQPRSSSNTNSAPPRTQACSCAKGSPGCSDFDFGPPSFGFERHVAQTLNDQVVLRAEVTVERHLVGAGRLGDRIDANASDSVFVEQVPGGAGNPIAWARPTSRRIPHSPEFLLKFVSHDY